MFNPTKSYKTRDGRTARVVADDYNSQGSFNYLTIVTEPSGKESIFTHDSAGKCFGTHNHRSDLINDTSKSRAKTAEEVREEFLKHIHTLCKYWAELPAQTARERCDGVAFSILCTIDGTTPNLPAFDMIPCPHAEDKQFHIDRGENWYAKTVMNECQLHELFHK